MSTRYREWMWTSYDVKSWDAWKSMAQNDSNIRAMAGQVEVCPTTGRDHIQGMVRFQKSRTMDGVKKWFKDKTIHLEPIRGTIAQAREYCTKEDTRAEEADTFEIGDFEENKEKGVGQGARTDFKCLMDMTKEGKSQKDIYEEMPHMLRYTKAVETAGRMWAPKERDKSDFEVWCFWGEAGVGKTTKCKEICKENGLEYYEKMTASHSQGHFYEFYKGEPAVIVNEADHLPYDSLLQLLSPETRWVMIKGGSIPFPATKILLTSNRHPKDWHSNQIDSKICALIRRMHKIVEVKRESAVTNLDELLRERDSVLNLES